MANTIFYLIPIFFFFSVFAADIDQAYVIDAGSSGTRLYSYAKPEKCPKLSKTDTQSKCRSKKWTPGFAALTDNKKITALYDVLKEITGYTAVKVYGGATAGLRNLWDAQIERQQDRVEGMIQLLPGVKEAEYEWFAVNFENHSEKNTLNQKLAALYADPDKIKNFLSSGGASAQMGLYLTSTAIGNIDELRTEIKKLHSDENTQYWCQPAYGISKASEFISIMSFDAKGIIGYIDFHDGDLSSCEHSSKCILLVSFLAGLSSDATKKCIDLKRQHDDQDFKKTGVCHTKDGDKVCEFKNGASVKHNLIGGAKETLFSYFIYHTIKNEGGPGRNLKFDYDGYTKSGKSSKGLKVAEIFGNYLSGGVNEAGQIKKIADSVYELMVTDSFFNLVTNFVSANKGNRNAWASAGAVIYIEDLQLPTTLSDEGAWTKIFISQYYKKIGFTDSIATKGDKGGDWSLGCAFHVLSYVPVQQCEFLVTTGTAGCKEEDVNSWKGKLLAQLEGELNDLF